ncbi:MAG: SIR2 family protein [Acidobacteriota bacterium]|nr:SIR2 family protein [Acidobacteriota bacterium]
MNIPYPIISDISKGRCLPFIGAGFSKNAVLTAGLSMPDWDDLTKILEQQAATPFGSPPLVVAQRYQDKFGRVQLIEAIREALHPENARPGHAHRAFAKLPFDTIYTTNFDLLLEEAYRQELRPFRSLAGELQLPFHAGRTASSIVKMHGDLRHEEHIIATQNDYDAFLSKYPVVATHLSAMLITRTPLFIGYSLSDPDFKKIREVVRTRLGDFERMSYVVQFDVPPEEIEAGFREKIHIISLTTGASTRDSVLAKFFYEILVQLDTHSGVSLRSSRPDVFEAVEPEQVHRAAASREDAALIESTSRLCFVMMPFKGRFDEIYRNLVAPVVVRQGLSPMRADEMAGPGFIVEQIRVAIQQARLCIADVTGNNANVLYEIGLAQAMKKPLILLAERESTVPFDVAQERVIFYDEQLDQASDALKNAISVALAGSLVRATQQFEIGAYPGAIAAAAVVLEQRLICLLQVRQITRTDRMSIGQMLRIMKDHKLVSSPRLAKLLRVADLRNQSVHARLGPGPTQKDAQFVLEQVQDFLKLTSSTDCP